jgi:flavin-binding protein dodecin
MSHHVYKIVEVVGSSTIGIEDAIRVAVHEASQSLRKLRWFEVIETRGHVEEGVVAHWQVRLRIGFTLESSAVPPPPKKSRSR